MIFFDDVVAQIGDVGGKFEDLGTLLLTLTILAASLPGLTF
jgi:hypothetical protein